MSGTSGRASCGFSVEDATGARHVPPAGAASAVVSVADGTDRDGWCSIIRPANSPCYSQIFGVSRGWTDGLGVHSFFFPLLLVGGLFFSGGEKPENIRPSATDPCFLRLERRSLRNPVISITCERGIDTLTSA